MSIRVKYRVPHNLPTEAAPHVTRVAPLILLLARERLSATEAVLAKTLAAKISDWSEVERIASQKRCLPFVYRHISTLGLLAPNAPELQRMKLGTLLVASNWLKIAGAQRNFLQDCIAPLDLPHLFFKGISISRYYMEPALRFTRDIDVLVRKDAVWAVLKRARSLGYAVILDASTGRLVQNDRDLRALVRYRNDIPLISPKGVMIELHSDLWHGEGFSPPGDPLEAVEKTSVAGESYSVMPTSMLFCYLCQHHNRHLWSSLNWLADISALRSAPGFDAVEVLATAARLGLTEVVEATLAFDDLCRQRPSGHSIRATTQAEEAMRLCVLNMDGDEETARSLYFERITRQDDWRKWPEQRLSDRRFVWKSRVTTGIDHYISFPLPLWLHWVYPIGRAMQGVSRILREAWRGRGESG